MNTNGESLRLEKNHVRTRLLALLLSVFSACDSNQQPFAEDRLVATSADTATAKPAVAQPFSKSFEAPVICINGYLEAGEKDLIINRIRKAFEKIDADLLRINPDNFDQLRQRCDGFIAVGGDDLDTRRLPKPTALHSKAVLTPEHRQTFDETYIRWAREKQKPLLAECLGMQQVVVYEGEGGELIQHIPDLPNSLDHNKNHSVSLKNEASVFGLGETILVRSRHHQAPKEPLPHGLEVVGRSEDGLAEAMISKDGLVWGIMWHPKTQTDWQVYQNFVGLVKERKSLTEK